MTQKIAHAEIVKVDEDKRLVFGWASIIKDESGKILLDRQDDFIDSEDELEGAAYDYVLNSRDGGEMHVRRGVSKMVESVVFTEEKQRALGIPVGSMPTGWWIGFKVTDNSVWNQVKKGEYAGFSVHGSGRRESTELPLSKITEIGKSMTTKKISIEEMASKTQMFNTELSKVGDKPGHPFRGNQYTSSGPGAGKRIASRVSGDRSKLNATGSPAQKNAYQSEFNRNSGDKIVDRHARGMKAAENAGYSTGSGTRAGAGARSIGSGNAGQKYRKPRGGSAKGGGYDRGKSARKAKKKTRGKAVRPNIKRGGSGTKIGSKAKRKES